MTTTDRARGVQLVRAGAGTSWWVVGDTYTFKATSEDTNRRFTLFEASIPPQAGPPPHVHQVEDEAYYLLEGELEVLDHDRWLTVRGGDFVHIPPGTRHAFRNPGIVPSRMLVFLSPAGFENFFFEVGQPARPGEQAPPLGPEELERTVAAAPSYGMELHLPDGA
jgi:mannose-6-phosphate isomerase-like protein (cupin superfamily)